MWRPAADCPESLNFAPCMGKMAKVQTGEHKLEELVIAAWLGLASKSTSPAKLVPKIFNRTAAQAMAMNIEGQNAHKSPSPSSMISVDPKARKAFGALASPGA